MSSFTLHGSRFSLFPSALWLRMREIFVERTGYKPNRHYMRGSGPKSGADERG